MAIHSSPLGLAGISTTAPHTPINYPQWKLREADERAVQTMVQQQGVPDVVARVLASRGVAVDAAPAFLNPTLRHFLPDPSTFLDMPKAAARIAHAIQAQQKIAVFGDYDVDGATSSALLIRYFRALSITPIVYIPDRMKEGYGPNVAAFESLIKQGVELIITVDCGAMAFDPIAHAQAAKVDVVVLDHHLTETRLPNAHAHVNPNRYDASGEHKQLAAVGVTFITLVALNRALREAGSFAQHKEPDLLHMLDIVALGTVCDVVPLTGINRAFVSQGLKKLAARGNVGLRSLADVARLQETPTTYHAGFLLGPRINAGGRVSESDLGARILSTEDDLEATELARRLDAYNAERQAIEATVLERAKEAAEKQANAPMVLISGEGWHAGVIGIVAGRLKEMLHKPVAVVSIEHNMGKGSARSVSGVDFGAAVHAAHAHGLVESGGGHPMAAGFSVLPEKMDALHAFWCQQMEAGVARYGEHRHLSIDAWVQIAGLNESLMDALDQVAPFGIGNPSPTLALADVKIVHSKILKEKHLRLVLADAKSGGNHRITAMAFGVVGKKLGDALMNTRAPIHVAGSLKRNVWQGETSLQLMIEDVAVSTD